MKLRFGVVGVLLALALTGCGDGEDPAPPDASPTSSATTAEPSEEPSETFDPTKETAKEFIRRWIRLRNEMLNTGKAKEFLSVTSDSCRDCLEVVENRERVLADGGWLKTDGWEATSITHDGGPQWSVVVREAPFRWAQSKDAEVQESAQAEWRLKLYILRDEKRWVLTDIAKVVS